MYLNFKIFFPNLFIFYVWTCEASMFDLNSNRTSRFNSKVTGRFENFELPATFAVVP